MRVTLVLLLAFTLSPTPPASAQVPVAPGQRIRVTTVDGSRTTGIVSDVSSESISLRQEDRGREVVIPFSRTDVVERSGGKQPRFKRNFIVAYALTPVALGTALALSASEGQSEAFAWGFVGGLVLGIPVGLIFGSILKHEVWLPVPLAVGHGATFSISPVLGGRNGVIVSVTPGGRR